MTQTILRCLPLMAMAILAAPGSPCQDCNSNGVADALELAQGSPDCNSNGIPDACDILPSRLELSAAAPLEMREAVLVFSLGPVDGDRSLDVVTVSRSPQAVSIRRNDGTGGFGPAEEIPLEGAPRAAAVADIDADGDSDVAIVIPSAILILANEGGTLESVRRIPMGSEPSRILAEDLDGDGLPDLVTSNTLGTDESLSISVVLHADPKTFATPRNYEAGPQANGMVSGDVDGDGDIDIVLSHEGWTLSLLRNDGNGAFPGREQIDPGTGEARLGISAGDLDGDGSADLLTTRSSNRVEILFNPGDTALRWTHAMRAGMEVKESWIGDLDRDGAADMVFASRFSPKLWVFLGRGKGVFTMQLSSGLSGVILGISPGDVDGDGDVDLAVFSSGQLWIAATEVVPVSPDADRDGIPDVCRGSSFIRGDALEDGALDMADAIAILGGLFLGEPAGSCPDARDADDDGSVAITDAIAILAHLFQGGAAPPAPSAECAEDPTEDTLGCADFDACRG